MKQYNKGSNKYISVTQQLSLIDSNTYDINDIGETTTTHILQKDTDFIELFSIAGKTVFSFDDSRSGHTSVDFPLSANSTYSNHLPFISEIDIKSIDDGATLYILEYKIVEG